MTVKKFVFLLMLVVAASTWMTYVERPTRGNLKRAVRDTLPLL